MADVPVLDRPTHAQLLAQLELLLEQREPLLTQMANMSALLYWSLPDVNWVGVYLLRGDTLHLGPFHGKPACTGIPVGSGVCGTAVSEGRTQHVPDVHTFPGHIACDTASRAEVVVPLVDGSGRCWGVLDADSPVPDRFTFDDVRFFEQVAALLRRRHETAGGMIFPLDNSGSMP
ncbi:MAG: GAF domain-containing protein [Bacteroidota bacterium]|nr:GAF domain-containing protein [Bacteroidota bacterium]